MPLSKTNILFSKFYKLFLKPSPFFGRLTRKPALFIHRRSWFGPCPCNREIPACPGGQGWPYSGAGRFLRDRCSQAPRYRGWRECRSGRCQNCLPAVTRSPGRRIPGLQRRPPARRKGSLPPPAAPALPAPGPALPWSCHRRQPAGRQRLRQRGKLLRAGVRLVVKHVKSLHVLVAEGVHVYAYK